MNALVHLLILSIVSFFHFLLDHRLADIQDWVFSHGWEVLGAGKLISLFLISRFVGILSIDRRPFFSLLSYKRGFWRKELFVCLIFSVLGLVLTGIPSSDPNYEFNFYRSLVNFFGIIVFYGSEAALMLMLNSWMPLKRGHWPYQIVIFSLISFIVHKSLFLFGVNWGASVIFFMMMVFFLLRLRGDFNWIHSLTYMVVFVTPLNVIFGLDPLWGEKFAPFKFTHDVSGAGVAVFTVLSIFYLRRRKLG